MPSRCSGKPRELNRWRDSSEVGYTAVEYSAFLDQVLNKLERKDLA